MKRSVLIVIIVSVFIAIVGVIAIYKFNKNTSPAKHEELTGTIVTIQLSDSGELSVGDPSYALNNKRVYEKEYIRAKDIITEFDFDSVDRKNTIGRIQITKRIIDNGDSFIFTKFHNDVSEDVSITFQMPFFQGNRFNIIDFDERYIERVHDNTIGVDPTTNAIGIIEVYNYDQLRNSVMLSKNYISKELTTTYENGDSSKLRELVSEEKDFRVHTFNDQVVLEYTLHSFGEDISENWFLMSSKPLFEKEENLTDWITYVIEEYQRANNWYTAEGPYKKLPWSIEPFTEMGYGRNLGVMQDKRPLDYYERSGERFYYNIVINSITNLFAYKEGKGDLWETEYTSTWLKNSYGLVAPYVDTRHNENIALFLNRAGNLLSINELENAQQIYANFLVNQVKEGNKIVVEDAYLIADYFSPSQQTKTHASLNHAVGEMNFLLDSYRDTKNEQYLEVAQNIRRAIETLGEEWIAENGDLWYQVNEDLTFTGTDYVTLTLSDLLFSQNKWEENNMDRSELFDKLIYSKTTFLVSSDEDIPSYMLELLEKQGFGKILNAE
ncbi:hypothetical protein [Bacillus alkalisoli]|uniref:hypothetical protein n=1 Tax=Bacillus alkalisoli TaxID=2011008 RepID=UPI000C24CE1E|nr:hypothetical protein [Bacillus alkalisoli]